MSMAGDDSRALMRYCSNSFGHRPTFSANDEDQRFVVARKHSFSLVAVEKMELARFFSPQRFYLLCRWHSFPKRLGIEKSKLAVIRFDVGFEKIFRAFLEIKEEKYILDELRDRFCRLLGRS